MNERIEELMLRSGTTGVRQVWFTRPELAKFAELIVGECIDAAGEPADGLIKGDTWHDGVRASCQSIKQHFGVE